jgi:hypothetical protein
VAATSSGRFGIDVYLVEPGPFKGPTSGIAEPPRVESTHSNNRGGPYERFEARIDKTVPAHCRGCARIRRRWWIARIDLLDKRGAALRHSIGGNRSSTSSKCYPFGVRERIVRTLVRNRDARPTRRERDGLHLQGGAALSRSRTTSASRCERFEITMGCR